MVRLSAIYATPNQLCHSLNGHKMIGQCKMTENMSKRIYNYKLQEILHPLPYLEIQNGWLVLRMILHTASVQNAFLFIIVWKFYLIFYVVFIPKLYLVKMNKLWSFWKGINSGKLNKPVLFLVLQCCSSLLSNQISQLMVVN